MDWLGGKYEPILSRVAGRRSLSIARPSRRTLEARIRVLEARIDTLETGQWDFDAPFDTVEECNAGICGYVRSYLAAGPAELTHPRFHRAETNAALHYEACAVQIGTTCEVCDSWSRMLRP
jgi:hypothetical protein